MGLRVADLRCQLPTGVFALGKEPVRLSWRLEADATESVLTAYEIQMSTTSTFESVETTGTVESSDQNAVVAPGGQLDSREIRFYRVRVATGSEWSPWSEVLRVEAGLLEAGDWRAKAISHPHDEGDKGPAPAPLLRREFQLAEDVASARLYVTSLGVHRVSINGVPVSDDLLAPGWTTYHRRLLSETYDVTSLLKPGSNVIAGVLGDGWYRGRLGWPGPGSRLKYGSQVALLAQLEMWHPDGSRSELVTDEDWRASFGEVRSSDLYDGCEVDLSKSQPGWDEVGFDPSGWVPVIEVPCDLEVIEPRMAPPVRVIDTIQVEPTQRPDGTIRLDAGQNISGFVRLAVRGKAGDEVTVRHAEVLEADGALHTRALRTAKATDVYHLDGDGLTRLEPMFTFHGFQYADVITDCEVVEAECVAIASDLPRRSSFRCSDDSLNRFHENVLWSARDNFVSVPTDCPQRDERLGWTGDAQAFIATACTIFDAERFWSSWLIDLALDQDPKLGPSTVVPDVVIDGESQYGRAGWADAATIIPWAVYEAYGDVSVLERQYPSMRSWVESLRGRVDETGLLPEAMQFGDWLDPNAPAERPWEARTDSTFLANAFYSHSARLVARAAKLLGRDQDWRDYSAHADEIAAQCWGRWREHAFTTQTGCAVALEFDIAPVEEKEDLRASLAKLVTDADGAVATGFLGTPLVLHALSDGGYFDEAYLMLLRHEMPSWLYQVDMGATTVWERWNAILPDGSIHPGTMKTPPEMEGGDAHMLSFNHYAYGAMIDWVYRHVAGIAPDPSDPGYRSIVMAPRPARGIDRAEASLELHNGTAAISWTLDGDVMTAEVRVPVGSTAHFDAPLGPETTVSVAGVAQGNPVTLGHGVHQITITGPQVAGPPDHDGPG